MRILCFPLQFHHGPINHFLYPWFHKKKQFLPISCAICLIYMFIVYTCSHAYLYMLVMTFRYYIYLQQIKQSSENMFYCYFYHFFFLLFRLCTFYTVTFLPIVTTGPSPAELGISKKNKRGHSVPIDNIVVNLRCLGCFRTYTTIPRAYQADINTPTSLMLVFIMRRILQPSMRRILQPPVTYPDIVMHVSRVRSSNSYCKLYSCIFVDNNKW